MANLLESIKDLLSSEKESDTTSKELIQLKKEVARTESAFQVQIYNGNITEANKIMLAAKNTFKQYPALLSFESPNYKVRIGSFRTRLEAEKNLIEIKKTYPAAFVIGLK